jgi:hypothetical protein
MTKLRKKSFVIPSEVRSRAWLGEASEESAVLCYSSHRINNIVQKSPPQGLDKIFPGMAKTALFPKIGTAKLRIRPLSS